MPNATSASSYSTLLGIDWANRRLMMYSLRLICPLRMKLKDELANTQNTQNIRYGTAVRSCDKSDVSEHG